VKGGRLKIINESRYPTAEVEELVRFALSEIDVKGSKLLAFVTDGKASYSGHGGERSRRFGDRVFDLARKHKARYIAHVRLGPKHKFPIREFKRFGYFFDYETWQEALVGVMAHEGAHCQYAYDGHHNMYGSGVRYISRGPSAGRTQFFRRGDERIEPKCAAKEIGMLRRYREHCARLQVEGEGGKEAA
jgi:hypothetical protein